MDSSVGKLHQLRRRRRVIPMAPPSVPLHSVKGRNGQDPPSPSLSRRFGPVFSETFRKGRCLPFDENIHPLLNTPCKRTSLHCTSRPALDGRVGIFPEGAGFQLLCSGGSRIPGGSGASSSWRSSYPAPPCGGNPEPHRRAETATQGAGRRGSHTDSGNSHSGPTGATSADEASPSW